MTKKEQVTLVGGPGDAWHLQLAEAEKLIDLLRRMRDAHSGNDAMDMVYEAHSLVAAYDAAWEARSLEELRLPWRGEKL